MTHHDDSQPTKTLRIIYAEDMRELREIAQLALAREGHHIDCVADGQEALDRIAAAPEAYDLVITDHHMPRLNGIGLITQLHLLPYRGKILVFCSELSPSVTETYLRLKVDRILYKPVFPSELRRVLSELFAPEVCAT